MPVTSVRDLELYYELHGPPRAPCLLLVHGLGSSARMNHPGRSRGNWRWQLAPGQLTRELAARLRDETESAGRV